MKHIMRLKEQPFYNILKGKKIIELRLYDEKRQKLRIGDEIEFHLLSDTPAVILTKITNLHIFNSFAELYQALPVQKFGYTVEEAKNASPEDMNLYYSPDEQKQYGVVGIEFIVTQFP